MGKRPTIEEYDNIEDIPRETPEFKAIKKTLFEMMGRGPPRIW